MGKDADVVAIVGVGCRLPGGVTHAAGARALFAEGRDVVGRGPSWRWSPPERTTSGKPVPSEGAFLDELDRFDAELFGVSEREATALDPQQRLLLEVAWSALEHAGVAPDGLHGSRTSVTVGMGLTDWERRTFGSAHPERLDAWSGTGVFDSVAAGRVAYTLGLRGAAMAVHTACSSSLVALHLALRSLRSGECDLALAGGVNLLLAHEPSVYFAELGALSPSGRCRTFDAAADGYVRGEGCVLFVLERLEDARRHDRRILATLLGSAVNHDGRTHTLTAPSPRAQADVIREALSDAGLRPGRVGFVEAHGTGTPLGDPVEVEALATVFGQDARPLHVGSGKTVHGHLEAAAGAAGVLRAITALRLGRVPPHLHLRTPSAKLRTAGTRLVLGGSGESWSAEHAGVSAFGLSGTNAHLVLGAPEPEPRPTVRGPVLVAVSGATPDAARARVAQVASALARGLPLAEVARAATEGRALLRYRAFRVLDEGSEPGTDWPVTAARRLPPVVWAFAGQGSQVAGAGRKLHAAFPAFRRALEEVDALLREAGGDPVLPVLLEPGHPAIDHTATTQPAVFALGWALAELLRSLGATPDAVLGHSVGEVTAAVVASVVRLPDAARLVVARGRLLGALPSGGSMVALRCSEEALRAVLPRGAPVGLAAVNGPDDVVVSGERAAVEAVIRALPGVPHTPLVVSHAFHSPLVDGVVEPLRRVAAGMRFQPPAIPLYSTLTGGLAEVGLADPGHWARQAREPVRFADAVRAAAGDGHALFVELGARRVLAPAGSRSAPGSRWLSTLRAERDELACVQELVGELFAEGARPVFAPLYQGAARAEVAPYPFARTRFWIDQDRATRPTFAVREVPAERRDDAIDGPIITLKSTVTADDVRSLAAAPAGATIVADGELAYEAAVGFAASVRAEGAALRVVGREGDVDLTLARATGHDEVRITAEGDLVVPRLVLEVDPLGPVRLDPARPVLITGGTGHLGLALVDAAADAGARWVVLLSRQAMVEASRAVAWRERGLKVELRACDVTDPERLRAEVARLGAPAAVVHAAGTAWPAPWTDADPERWRSLWDTKVVALRILCEVLSPEVPVVAVGSVAGLWGSPGLAAYGAASRAMDGVLAARRRAGGRGATAVLGPLAGGGMVSEAELAAYDRAGVRPLEVSRAAACVIGALAAPGPVGFGGVDWARLVSVVEALGRRSLFDRVRPTGPSESGRPPMEVRSVVLRELGSLLGRQGLDPEAGLFDLGLDSVLAVELAERLQRALGHRVAPTVAFDHPTIERLVRALSGSEPRPVPRPGAPVSEPVAIVGFSCRFPGGEDPEAFWAFLEGDGDAVGPVPADRWDPAEWPEAPREGGFLSDLPGFDHEAFGMGAAEAAWLDPQQRLVLEVGWEALERAGLAPDGLVGRRGAVILGIGRSEYWDRARSPDTEGYAFSGTGNDASFAPGRLAHLLGLRGPVLAVNTACSSSLVALHLAARSLRDGEVDLALAGGVNVLASPEAGTWLARIGAASPTHRCRAFSADADGYVRGEGCGMVVLERLSDARRLGHRVWAVLAGSAVAHDGRSAGLTVPNPDAQEQVMHAALAEAGVRADEVQVLEAHGTGTPLGDPIELGAVARVHDGRSRPLVIGALKTRIGHLEAAAGVAGVVKQILAMAHGKVPANLHLARRNPALPGAPVHLPRTLEDWPVEPGGTTRRIAAVSAFGISGTNAHVVLFSGDPAPPDTVEPAPGPRLLVASSHSPAALVVDVSGLAASGLGVSALASGLVRSRARRTWRVSGTGPVEALARAVPVRASPQLRVAFVCTGQGVEGPAMARRASAGDPRFRAILDDLLTNDADLRAALLGERACEGALVQPTLVALALVLARWWREVGVEPVVVAGHSLGELAAASIAGALTSSEALRFARARGALCEGLPRDGRMVSVRASEARVREALRGIDGVSVAAVHGDHATVVSGLARAVDAVVAALGPDAGPRALGTSHAFHSPCMDGALPELRELARNLAHEEPRIPLVSGLTGLTVSPDAEHWVRHLREPVRFADVVRELRGRCDLIVELGPREILGTIVGFAAPELPVLGADLVVGGGTALLEAAGRAWCHGAPVALEALVAEVPSPGLPTTTRVRRRAWLDLPSRGEEVPIWDVRWVPHPAAGVAVEADVHEIADRVGALRVLATASPGRVLALRTRGAFGGSDPEAAAVDALLVTALAERPELDARLLDDVPADLVGAALAVGEARVRWVDGALHVPRVERAAVGPPLRVERGSTWLVTGGAGGVGAHVVGWLLGRGARVAAVGRSARSADLPHEVAWHRCDLADPSAVQLLVEAVRPDGVVHAAGVARGALLREETSAGLDLPWAAKVEGARSLVRHLLPEVPFVACGSAVAWLGQVGQGAYGSANAGLEAIVRGRRAAGGRAWVLRFGPWTVGMAKDQARHAEGVRSLPPVRALRALSRAADGMPLDVDWAEFGRARPAPWVPGEAGAPASVAGWLEALPEAARRGVLLRRILDEASEVLRSPPGADTGWFDAGADSLAAVEISRRLARALGRPLPATLLFDHGTPAALVDALLPAGPVVSAPRRTTEPIAVVGMGIRFPGASTPEELWSVLMERRVPLREVPPERWDVDAWYAPQPVPPGRSYARVGGFLPDIDLFDPEAFGMAPREASSLDPQQRLLLEVAREALERAGHADLALRGSRAGVFVGIADRGWLHRFRQPGAPLYPDAWAGTGAEPSFAAGRLAFSLGLRGPAVSLDTTCSSTLVALHLAARSLRDGECDLALAGGVALQLLPDDTAWLCAVGALSPTGRCHVFDARADGYVRSEGCGVFVLRRLSDALRDGDEVLGVILGSAVGHDGASGGLTVPSGEAQEAVLREALAGSGASARQVAWLEAHGTGTRLGDPVEVRAARAVYGDRDTPLLLGAVKANLGHAELAAGAASLAKVLLGMAHGLVPPQPVPVEPNPELDLRGLHIVGEPTPLPPGALVAVSGFGLSGTNAHLVLGPPPARAVATPAVTASVEPSVTLLVASASSPAAVVARVRQLLAVPGLLRDVAASAHRVAPGPWRAAVVVADRTETVVPTPERPRSAPTVGFLYSGQGSQHAGMGLALAASSPSFGSALDACAAVLDPMLGRSLRAILADGSALGRTGFAQPCLFAVGWAKTVVLRELGLEPTVVAGHSLGELLAATVAGSWTLEDALGLVVDRGRLMEDLALPGAMVAVALAEEVVRPLLAPGCELAAVNADDEVVLAGPSSAVEDTLGRLPPGSRVTRLAVGRPFHCAGVEPMLDRWERRVASVGTRAPKNQLVSLLTGRVEADELRSASFWRRHAREPVRARDAARTLGALGVDVWLDLGAHPALLGLVHRTVTEGRFVATERRGADGARVFAEAVGEAWVAGLPIDLGAWDQGRRRPRVALPPTPLDRRRFWLEEPVVRPPVWEVELVEVVPGHAAPPSRLLELSTGDLTGRLLALASAVEPDLAVVVRDDPDGAAVLAAVRCLRLERPGHQIRAVRLDDETPLALALTVEEPEVVARGGRCFVPRLRAIGPPPGAFRCSGTWLVTGGLGAVGLHLAGELADRGARCLVLASRRPPVDEDPRLAGWRARGVVVEVVAVDVSDRDAMRQLVERLPPDGVVHAAGITRPQATSGLDEATVRETLRAKVEGARHLDELLGDRPLQAFVLVSSIAAVWGSRDLLVYAAANGFLDGLARARRARGRVASSFAFGPWGGGGMVDDARAAELGRAGLRALEPRAAARITTDLIAAGRAAVVVARFDPDRLVPALEVGGPQPLFAEVRPVLRVVPSSPAPVIASGDRIEAAVRRIMGLQPGRHLAADHPLSELGFDSLMATELKAALLLDGIDLPLGRLLGGPSLHELEHMASARVLPGVPEVPGPLVSAPPASDPEPDRVLVWTHLAAVLVGIALASGAWALL